MAEPAQEAMRWLVAARAGSRDALGELFKACQAYLLLIARQELAPDLQAKGGASDLLQETFIDAYRDFEHFHGDTEAELLSWLRRLLLNNLANFTRRYRATNKRHLAAEVAFTGGSAATDRPEEPAADGSSPSGHAMAHEQAEAVQRALERLPDDYRQVILLRYQEQLSFEEIGRRLERSPNAAQKLWARALERLQQELEVVP